MTDPDLPRPHALPDVDMARFTKRAQNVPADVRERVAAIMDDVARDGDAALARWTRELDGADLSDPWLPQEEWDAGADRVDPELAAAIDRNLARIELFHMGQQAVESTVESAPGVLLGRRPVPFRRVACYVPGGRARYPSTVLMTATLARLAGCQDIIVVTPPTRDGNVDPSVLYAARAAGATRVLRAGGAQAVAALAYGTDAVHAVQCIVGPGNAYVTAAKQRVQDRVRIDSPAGPSELLVLASGDADPDRITWDLLAQAEHDPDAQVLLVTPDAALAEAVADRLPDAVKGAARGEVIAASLRDHGAILVASDMDAAVEFSNAYAPEHLTLMTPDPQRILDRITAAGSVFLGPHAPVSLGDYGSGTNHVLPTMGYARTRGGLCLDDFRTWITWQSVTPDGLQGIGPDVVALAEAEGLQAHADAVTQRLQRALEETP